MSHAEPRAALVVAADDDPDIVELLAIVLERAGHRVLTARDGSGALALTREHHPDLCVLDGRMPGLAGFEVLRLIRSEAETAGVRVLVLTATVDEEREIRRHGIEPDAFMSKPFDPESLLRTVADVLGRPAGD